MIGPHLRRLAVAVIAAAYLVTAVSAAADEPEKMDLVIDADYSIDAEGARAIEAGIRAALDGLDYRIGGIEIRVRAADHRGNVKRSFATMRGFLQNDRALVLFGGVHSPPYLAHRDFLNENAILTLLPWSAGGPITRPEAGQSNWIFRLSIDDTRSGDFLVAHAVDRAGCRRTGLVLLDTSWGRWNRSALTDALYRRHQTPSVVAMFPTTLGTSSAARIASDLARSDADCVILLANSTEGAMLVNALYQKRTDIRVISHWGILAGDFAGAVPAAIRDAMHVEVLQTCGLRSERERRPALATALRSYFGDRVPRHGLPDISGSAGFVHGHDLTLLLAAAAEQVAETPGWLDGDAATRRALLRDALEQLRRPVDGILRTYSAPFRPYRPDDPDSHEALGPADLCMVRFVPDGSLALAD